MILHEHIPRRKQRKPDAKTRALMEDWNKLVNSHRTKPVQPTSTKKYTLQVPEGRRQAERIPSLDSGVGNASKAPEKVYTGDKVLGIAVMHKSCLQPIFNEQAAVDVAHMRR